MFPTTFQILTRTPCLCLVGTITATELKTALIKMGNKIDDNDLASLMAAADIDGNGTIDYEEFVAATANLNKLEKEECCLQVQNLTRNHSEIFI